MVGPADLKLRSSGPKPDALPAMPLPDNSKNIVKKLAHHQKIINCCIKTEKQNIKNKSILSISISSFPAAMNEVFLNNFLIYAKYYSRGCYI